MKLRATLVGASLCLGLLSGCAAPRLVPISQGRTDEVRYLAADDPVLSCLCDRFDRDRATLLWAGPPLPARHARKLAGVNGTYDASARLLYRNDDVFLGPRKFTALLRHEFAHWLWFEKLTPAQRRDWHKYAAGNLEWLALDLTDPHFEEERFAYAIEFLDEKTLDQLERQQILEAGCVGRRWRVR